MPLHLSVVGVFLKFCSSLRLLWHNPVELCSINDDNFVKLIDNTGELTDNFALSTDNSYVSVDNDVKMTDMFLSISSDFAIP